MLFAPAVRHLSASFNKNRSIFSYPEVKGSVLWCSSCSCCSLSLAMDNSRSSDDKAASCSVPHSGDMHVCGQRMKSKCSVVSLVFILTFELGVGGNDLWQEGLRPSSCWTGFSEGTLLTCSSPVIYVLLNTFLCAIIRSSPLFTAQWDPVLCPQFPGNGIYQYSPYPSTFWCVCTLQPQEPSTQCAVLHFHTEVCKDLDLNYK